MEKPNARLLLPSWSQKAPSDGDAQSIIRKASVAQSLDQGKWKRTRTLEKIKDEEESIHEQASRSVTVKTLQIFNRGSPQKS